MPSNLLKKTEMKIEGITLQDANLTALAATVARALGLATSDILVVDTS